MDRHPEFCVVLVTAPDQICAQAMAKTLLEEKLAACINCFAVESFYTWEGELNQDQEIQLTIKTQQHLFAALSRRIMAIHPYDTPEIIALPIVAGTPKYLGWLRESTLRP